jgi:hypothetical protein
VPTASLQNQSVKLFQAVEVFSFRDIDSLSLGTSDFSLNAIAMKTAEDRSGTRPKVQTVEVEALAGSPARLTLREKGCWTEFDILATLRMGPFLDSN